MGSRYPLSTKGLAGGEDWQHGGAATVLNLEKAENAPRPSEQLTRKAAHWDTCSPKALHLGERIEGPFFFFNGNAKTCTSQETYTFATEALLRGSRAFKEWDLAGGVAQG